MNVVFARDAAWMSSPPDNTPDAVVIPFAERGDAERLARAHAIFPRAAIVAELADARDAELALDAIRAGAHGTTTRGASEDERGASIALAVARRAAEDARVAREIAARDEALWVMSHELRNPLNVIAMTAALLVEASELSAERREVHLKKIERGVARMTILLDDTSDLARIAAGTLSLARAPIGVRALLEQALADIGESRDVTVTIDAAEGLTVDVDAARIGRALHTAVGRVVYATAKGKGKGGLVQITARDLGDAVELQIHASEARAASLGRGAALQLTVAARVIEAHGGQAWTGADLERSCDLRLTLPKP